MFAMNEFLRVQMQVTSINFPRRGRLALYLKIKIHGLAPNSSGSFSHWANWSKLYDASCFDTVYFAFEAAILSLEREQT